jgi:hypothetical protein
MLYLGSNIRSQEFMQPLQPKELFAIIKHDTHKLADLIGRLRKLMAIDTSAYTAQKTKLPYFCISTFEGNTRNTQNYLETNFLVLDFDKIPYHQLSIAQHAIGQDQRVLLAFRTPSNAGLKVLFALQEPVSNKKTFSDLGKAFGTAFANQFNLLSFLDMKTFDVTRASFIAPDPAAIFNPQAAPIDWKEWVPTLDFTAAEPDPEAATAPIAEKANEPSADIYKEILQKLKPNTPKPVVRAVLPEALEPVVAHLNTLGANFQIALKEVRAIQYGAQIQVVHAAGGTGECNVFYGKRGYSVVRSNKATHHPQLTEILDKLLWQAIAQVGYQPQAATEFGTLLRTV